MNTPSPSIVPLLAQDGARSELMLIQGDASPQHVVYWLPALGVPAKHYLPLAEAFAARGVAMALHEWRGIGSSDRRAGRHCDWGYRELLALDVPVGIAQVRARWPQAKLWIAGHSLGGQLACLYASLHPDTLAGILLIASGAPYWRRFRFGALLSIAYMLASPLARLLGYLPGRRLGFGGNEARGLIADWSRSGRTGRYAADGMAVDFEQALGALAMPVFALRMRDDWMVPEASLTWLLGKMPGTSQRVVVMTPEQLAGQAADHFTWMKFPHAPAGQLLAWMERSEASRASLEHADS
ncbi:MAG TPA: alpha/beta fold hydrolase [Dyella sp.]|uniref:alpha/beta hydrolase family protein n=1 Tax=Dyella sp. TaxID=1869338 RepID=UPI002C70B780|nr:alpha/beta fold hydrolase [Dyella sp.]HTV84157.1 alpha/beta fold hydrolase [Dyella sp.]